MMDTFVLPSICEGMSNTILEAMACGVPAIVTRTGGNPELIAEGRSGYLFPAETSRCSTLLSRLAEQRNPARIRSSARRRAVEHFKSR